MRILITLILLVLLSGGAWILNFENRFVPRAPCMSNLEGTFIAKKDCDAYWESTGNSPPSSRPFPKGVDLIQRPQQSRPSPQSRSQ